MMTIMDPEAFPARIPERTHLLYQPANELSLAKHRALSSMQLPSNSKTSARQEPPPLTFSPSQSQTPRSTSFEREGVALSRYLNYYRARDILSQLQVPYNIISNT